jgi:uncharacterized protein (TIGR02001 family)
MKNTLQVLPILLAASALAQTAPAPAPAKSDWTQTHNLALATDYIFRGVTQIGGDGLALSGGTDVSHSSGFSFGVWAANVSFGGSSSELDVYAGYAMTLGDFTLSAGVISYHYEGVEVANTTEAYVGVAAYGLALKYSSSLTDYFGLENSDGVGYLSVGYTVEVPGVKDFSLGLAYGATTAEGDQEAYSDFKVSLSYPIAGYTATIAYTDVDGFDSLDVKDTFTFSLSRTF